MADINGIGWLAIMVITAIFSVTASLAVILTFLLFRDLRNSPFMKIVTYVSIADFLGNIAYLRIEKPEPGSAACVFQSFLNGAFYPCSWLWTTVLVYFLYILATEGQPPKQFLWYNIICWGVPVILFLIQTPFSEFKDARNYDFEVCRVAGDVGLIYHFITYYENQSTSGTQAPAFQVAKSALVLYPTWMIICWLPHVITVFLLDFCGVDGFGWAVVYYLGDILKVLHGGICAIIFFYKSKESRRLWRRLIFRMNEKHDQSVEIRSPSEFVENFIHSPSIVFGVNADPMRETVESNGFSISNSDL